MNELSHFNVFNQAYFYDYCLQIFIRFQPLYTRAYLKDKSVAVFSIMWGWMMPAIFVGVAAVANFSVYTYPHADGFAVT